MAGHKPIGIITCWHNSYSFYLSIGISGIFTCLSPYYNIGAWRYGNKAGHEVAGTTRQAEKSRLLQELGAPPVVVDVFDRQRLSRVVREVRPDVIIHQLTDLSLSDFAANGRIRRMGTRNLVDAARAAGVRRMIAQSIAWAYAPGEGPADESVPLDIEAPLSRRNMVESVQMLEQAVLEMERGIVLRYGMLYGPGTWYAPDGLIAEQVRQGELSIDEGTTSLFHFSPR